MPRHAADSIVIFDLDGTLFKTDTVSVPAVQEAFEQHGLVAPSVEDICGCFGKRSGAYQEFLRGRCPDELADNVEKHALRRELELIPETGRLYPGVDEALRALRQSVRWMAICSNGPRNYVHAVLESTGIAALFDHVRFRRPEDESKPQMVGDLLADLGLASGCGGVGVGDRHDDLEAAHRNGLRAIGAAYGFGQPPELQSADHVLESSRDLARVVMRELRSVC